MALTNHDPGYGQEVPLWMIKQYYHPLPELEIALHLKQVISGLLIN